MLRFETQTKHVLDINSKQWSSIDCASASSLSSYNYFRSNFWILTIAIKSQTVWIEKWHLWEMDLVLSKFWRLTLLIRKEVDSKYQWQITFCVNRWVTSYHRLNGNNQEVIAHNRLYLDRSHDDVIWGSLRIISISHGSALAHACQRCKGAVTLPCERLSSPITCNFKTLPTNQRKTLHNSVTTARFFWNVTEIISSGRWVVSPRGWKVRSMCHYNFFV